MNTFSAATMYADNLKLGAWAAWLVTVLLLVAGIQRIKKTVLFILMKLYEFFIQRNVLKL
jgi:hypothetical protein